MAVPLLITFLLKNWRLFKTENNFPSRRRVVQNSELKNCFLLVCECEFELNWIGHTPQQAELEWKTNLPNCDSMKFNTILGNCSIHPSLQTRLLSSQQVSLDKLYLSNKQVSWISICFNYTSFYAAYTSVQMHFLKAKRQLFLMMTSVQFFINDIPF